MIPMIPSSINNCFSILCFILPLTKIQRVNISKHVKPNFFNKALRVHWSTKNSSCAHMRKVVLQVFESSHWVAYSMVSNFYSWGLSFNFVLFIIKTYFHYIYRYINCKRLSLIFYLSRVDMEEIMNYRKEVS